MWKAKTNHVLVVPLGTSALCHLAEAPHIMVTVMIVLVDLYPPVVVRAGQRRWLDSFALSGTTSSMQLPDCSAYGSLLWHELVGAPRPPNRKQRTVPALSRLTEGSDEVLHTVKSWQALWPQQAAGLHVK